MYQPWNYVRPVTLSEKFDVSNFYPEFCGVSRIKKSAEPLWGQEKSRGDNINVYLAW